jgi:hypothetical protein
VSYKLLRVCLSFPLFERSDSPGFEPPVLPTAVSDSLFSFPSILLFGKTDPWPKMDRASYDVTSPLKSSSGVQISATRW